MLLSRGVGLDDGVLDIILIQNQVFIKISVAGLKEKVRILNIELQVRGGGGTPILQGI